MPTCSVFLAKSFYHSVQQFCHDNFWAITSWRNEIFQNAKTSPFSFVSLTSSAHLAVLSLYFGKLPIKKRRPIQAQYIFRSPAFAMPKASSGQWSSQLETKPSWRKQIRRKTHELSISTKMIEHTHRPCYLGKPVIESFFTASVPIGSVENRARINCGCWGWRQKTELIFKFLYVDFSRIPDCDGNR